MMRYLCRPKGRLADTTVSTLELASDAGRGGGRGRGGCLPKLLTGGGGGGARPARLPLFLSLWSQQEQPSQLPHKQGWVGVGSKLEGVIAMLG